MDLQFMFWKEWEKCTYCNQYFSIPMWDDKQFQISEDFRFLNIIKKTYWTCPITLTPAVFYLIHLLNYSGNRRLGYVKRLYRRLTAFYFTHPTADGMATDNTWFIVVEYKFNAHCLSSFRNIISVLLPNTDSWDTPVGIVKSLRTGSPRNHGSIPGWGKKFFPESLSPAVGSYVLSLLGFCPEGKVGEAWGWALNPICADFNKESIHTSTRP